MFQSISQDLGVDTLVSFSRRLNRVEDTLNVVLDTRAAWPLPVALDFTVSAANARECGSAGRI